MPQVFIPPQMRDLTGGVESVAVDGRTLGDVLAQLNRAYPGLAGRIAPGGSIAPGLAVAIDGAMTSRGLMAPVAADSEIHILPAIGGG